MIRAKHFLCAALAAALAECAVAETVLFDFETEAERKAIPVASGKGAAVSVTNGMAASGQYALRLASAPWKSGNNAWPSVTLRPGVTDWSGYDRLVVEVVCNADAARGRVFGFIAGPDGDYKKGWDIRPMLPLHHRGYRQWVIPLAGMRASTVASNNVARIHFCTKAEEFPDGFEICFDRIALLKADEPLPLPSGPCWARDIMPLVASEYAGSKKEVSRLTREMDHLDCYTRFCKQANLSAFRSPDMAVGTVSSMENPMPRGKFSARAIPDGGLRVRLARNEYESLQVVVAAQGYDLKGVKVAVEGDLTPMQNEGTGKGKLGTGVQPSNCQTVKPSNSFAASNIAASVVGYVRTKNLPPYKVGYNVATNGTPGFIRGRRDPEVGWWPDPILGFLDEADVAGTDVQSFWVRIRCPEDQPAGSYSGTLVVKADNAEAVRVPLTVRVNDFAMGRTSPLPLAINFSPGVTQPLSKQTWAAPEPPVKLWENHHDEWIDFLADYFISRNRLYSKYQPGDFNDLERLRTQGRLGLFNLGFWNPPNSTNEADMAVWREEVIPRLRQVYEEAERHGMLDRAYIYGCDEIHKDKFGAAVVALGELKREFPGIPFLTTAKDKALGVGSPLKDFDWFCPETQFCEFDKIEASRKAGHKIWWYICCFPHAPYANMFMECPAIEGRLLMGAQAVKYRPEGFLYYQISLWSSEKCIQSGPFTDWEPRSYLTYHGDGQWTCVGPDGIPLPTIRLENFRDGLEDLWYAKLLERKLKELGEDCSQLSTNINCSQIANINPKLPSSETPSLPEAEATTPLQPSNRQTVKPSNRASWARRAREALAVPCEVVDTLTIFTDDPAALYRWRDEMADLIEEASELGR